MTTTPNDAPIARALQALAPHAAARVPDDLAERAATAALRSASTGARGLVDALLSILRPVAALSTAAVVAALLFTGASSTSELESDPIASLVDEHLDVDALVAARYAAVDVTERAP